MFNIPQELSELFLRFLMPSSFLSHFVLIIYGVIFRWLCIGIDFLLLSHAVLIPWKILHLVMCIVFAVVTLTHYVLVYTFTEPNYILIISLIINGFLITGLTFYGGLIGQDIYKRLIKK